MKRILIIISLLLIAALSLAACKSGQATVTSEKIAETAAETGSAAETKTEAATTAPVAGTENAGTKKDEADTDDSPIRIGILQLITHESLDAARQGFMDKLAEEGYEDGGKIVVDLQNAFGDQANLRSMGEKLVRESDLLLAISTPAAQTIVGLEPDIPVLFTAVTDPVDAGLVESIEAPGKDVTGTSDQAPVDQQIALLLSLKEMENVGLIYNAGEPNSVLQAKEAKDAIEKAGRDVVEITVASTNDVQQAMTTLVSKVDGIYMPTDNTLASTAVTSGQIARDAGVPIVAAAIEHAEVGGTATIGISYYDLGVRTAEQAIEIINGKKASEIAVEYAENLELYINEDYAKAIGLDPDAITIP
jgi:putative ABC transport system substrate-binding protein